LARPHQPPQLHLGLGQGTTAFIQVTAPSGTVYTGLAINGAQTRLDGANTLLSSIDVYDCFFKPVSLASGAFVDP
jgi:hypothetical protein